ncbi:MAG: SGNH/GDSL hydrolase family protein [Chloroflexi bacterium]|nr:MAG: SGNH/GDSL hydrolase family protein [Chloroflexota bacterium]MBL1193023.1 SGNH/GDSL hydrolase family protein [Chloroflexota bacterium]NOH10316.1 hypothetical protein [Chloroflexota bacterium]
MKRRQLIINLILALVSTLFTFGIIEVAARVYIVNFAPPLLFNRYASLNQLNARFGQPSFVPHRYLGFVPAPDYVNGPNKHNALGLRGDEIELPKPEGSFRIATLGGSTTYSAGTQDYTESYPYLLQEELNAAGHKEVEVLNAGVFSYSTLESIINLQMRVMPLEPDMIIVYHGVNDVAPRLVWPRGFYVGDMAGFEARRLAFDPPWWERSTLVRALLVYTDRTESHISLRRNFLQAKGSYYGDAFVSQKVDGNYPSGIFENNTAARMLEINQPIYFERNLHNLVEIARANDIEVLLVTFTYSPEFDNEPRAFAEEYHAAYAEQNAIVQQIGDSTEAFVYDLFAVMPQDIEYFSDGIHFTPLGNQLRAEFLSEFILESELLP